VSVLSSELSKPGSLGDKIFTAILPGEFKESKRLTDISCSKRDGVIKILCVGTIEPRKNHENLLKAFILAVKSSRTPIELTLVGGRHSIEPALAERVRATVNNNPLIKWEEDADDARLKDLPVTCDFTIYPSVEEGFGLPIAESLWYGKPCICANFGAMMEVARDGGCLTVDVRKPEELARAIERLGRLRIARKVVRRSD
jgi:glycosyltransferase involved in cell wall biosynthesis